MMVGWNIHTLERERESGRILLAPLTVYRGFYPVLPTLDRHC